MANNQTLEGYVVRGKQLGRKLGFPTANLSIDDISSVKAGVWIVRVKIDHLFYYGVANIGYRPTVDNDRKSILEVYIFDFCEDIYGKYTSVEFLEYIREEIKFESIILLKEAIEHDITFAKAIVTQNYKNQI